MDREPRSGCPVRATARLSVTALGKRLTGIISSHPVAADQVPVLITLPSGVGSLLFAVSSSPVGPDRNGEGLTDR